MSCTEPGCKRMWTGILTARGHSRFDATQTLFELALGGM